MESSDEKVTVLLATHNRAHLIVETLLSIQKQKYPHFECLIIDDFSTDDTERVVADFCHEDARFIYFKKPRKYLPGLSDTRNYSLDLAQERGATLIQFFDDDDVMHPQKLELQIAPLLKDREVMLTFCAHLNFKQNTPIAKSYETMENVSFQNLGEDFLWQKVVINSLSPLFRLKWIHGARFDVELPYGEEREFFLRVLMTRPLIAIGTAQPLFYYRKHPQSNTGAGRSGLEKIGANVLIDEKLFSHLSTHNQLTARRIRYFVKRFTLDHYHPFYLKKIKDLRLSQGTFNRFELFWFRSLIALNYMYRRVFLKLLS